MGPYCLLRDFAVATVIFLILGRNLSADLHLIKSPRWTRAIFFHRRCPAVEESRPVYIILDIGSTRSPGSRSDDNRAYPGFGSGGLSSFHFGYTSADFSILGRCLFHLWSSLRSAWSRMRPKLVRRFIPDNITFPPLHLPRRARRLKMTRLTARLALPSPILRMSVPSLCLQAQRRDVVTTEAQTNMGQKGTCLFLAYPGPWSCCRLAVCGVYIFFRVPFVVSYHFFQGPGGLRPEQYIRRERCWWNAWVSGPPSALFRTEQSARFTTSGSSNGPAVIINGLWVCA